MFITCKNQYGEEISIKTKEIQAYEVIGRFIHVYIPTHTFTLDISIEDFEYLVQRFG